MDYQKSFSDFGLGTDGEGGNGWGKKTDQIFISTDPVIEHIPEPLFKNHHIAEYSHERQSAGVPLLVDPDILLAFLTKKQQQDNGGNQPEDIKKTMRGLLM